MAKTVVSLYDDMSDAQRAIEDLQNSGFRREDISLVTRHAEGEEGRVEGRDRGDNVAEGAGIGGGVGTVLGGVGGLLVGLGTLAIPGIGPILAAGPLVATLAGAGAGAIAGGVVGALVGLGIPEEEARYYHEGVRRGGTLVSVTTSDESVERARSIMQRYNPVNMEERVARWRESGWGGFDESAEPYSWDEVERERTRYGRTTDRGRGGRY